MTILCLGLLYELDKPRAPSQVGMEQGEQVPRLHEARPCEGGVDSRFLNVVKARSFGGQEIKGSALESKRLWRGRGTGAHAGVSYPHDQVRSLTALQSRVETLCPLPSLRQFLSELSLDGPNPLTTATTISC